MPPSKAIQSSGAGSATATPGVGAGVSRLQRLAGEQAQDVGEQQLLMLLLVIDAELDQLSRPGLKATLAKPLECRIDMLAIGAHLVAPTGASADPACRAAAGHPTLS